MTTTIEKTTEPIRELIFFAGQIGMTPEAPIINAELTDAEVEELTRTGLAWVDPMALNKNPQQPRMVFQGIEEMGISIAENGMPQDPTVYFDQVDGTWLPFLEDGEKRTRAVLSLDGNDAHEYGHMLVRIVPKTDDATLLKRAMLANKGEPLNAIEIAHGYMKLEEMGQTQGQIAEAFGSTQGTVSNKIRLTKLSPVLQRWLIEGKLSETHALLLLSVDDEIVRLGFASDAIDHKWSTRELDDAIKAYKAELERDQAPKLPLVPEIDSRGNSGELGGAGDEDAESQDEAEEFVCWKCDRSSSEVEAAGDLMVEETLCNKCNKALTAEREARQAAWTDSTPKTEVPRAETHDATAGQPKTSGGNKALSNFTPEAAANCDYCATRGLTVSDVFELAVRILDAADGLKSTIHDIVDELELQATKAKTTPS